MLQIPSCSDTSIACCTIAPFVKGEPPFWHEHGSWCVEIPMSLVLCLTSEQYELQELQALEARIYREFEAD